MTYKAILLTAVLGLSSLAPMMAVSADGAPTPPITTVAPATPAATMGSILVPEGTEVRLRFDDGLSSKSASEGDRFSVSLAAPIVLANGVVIPAGYRGAGEVTHSEKRKMMGQAGELNVRIDYLRVGDARIKLRGSKGGEGDSRVGTTVALTVLFGPIGLLKKGKDIEIQRGQEITVFVDADATLALPLAEAPAS